VSFGRTEQCALLVCRTRAESVAGSNALSLRPHYSKEFNLISG
jgi:hypothetical protein